jgi:hypothetical protein
VFSKKKCNILRLFFFNFKSNLCVNDRFLFRKDVNFCSLVVLQHRFKHKQIMVILPKKKHNEGTCESAAFGKIHII